MINEVNNSALAPNIANYHFGAPEIFFDVSYACTELFAIIFEEMNLIGGGTCRKNIIDFPGNDERLTLPKCVDIGAYRRIKNRQLHIVATICKYS